MTNRPPMTKWPAERGRLGVDAMWQVVVYWLGSPGKGGRLQPKTRRARLLTEPSALVRAGGR
jgi:hypothetical protein